MHTLIAMDSFKGTLSSKEAGRIVFDVLSEHLFASVETMAIADGGEGTLTTLIENNNGRYETVPVQDPLGRRIYARYGILNTRTAVVEMAEAAGLTKLSPEERNPLLTSTFGVGQLITHALNAGIRHFIIGLGGSSTNDAGMGMLSALGFRFLDRERHVLSPIGASLERLDAIDDSNVSASVQAATFTVACDVNIPLYGENGAAHVFASQKGGDLESVRRLERGLRRFADVAASYTGDKALHPRDGAAGGLGAGCRWFLGASLKNGFDVVYETCLLDDAIKRNDLIITGEGTIDAQTLMDKAPFSLAKRAKALDKTVIALAGALDILSSKREAYPFDAMFATMHTLNPDGTPLNKATAVTNLKSLAGEIARLITVTRTL